MLKPLLRADALLTLLALALAATVVTGRETPALEILAQRALAPALSLDLSLQDRGAMAVPPMAGDPFAVRAFAAPPPPVARMATPEPVAQPPQLALPQLPFRYVGRMVDEHTTILILARGEEIVTAQAGQDVGEWRVEEIAEAEVVFTYLPLKRKQSLPL